MQVPVTEVAEQFMRDTGHRVTFEFATAGQVDEKLSAGAHPDIVISSSGRIAARTSANPADAAAVRDLGTVRIGVAARKGAPRPDLSSVVRFRDALVRAESITYGDPARGATTGIHFSRIVDQLDLRGVLAGKTILAANGLDVVQKVAPRRSRTRHHAGERNIARGRWHAGRPAAGRAAIGNDLRRMDARPREPSCASAGRGPNRQGRAGALSRRRIRLTDGIPQSNWLSLRDPANKRIRAFSASLESAGDKAMTRTGHFRWAVLPIAIASLLWGATAVADAVSDWNIIANDTLVAAGIGPPPANRTLAMTQTAVYEAVNAITKRYPPDRVTPTAAPDASVAAAVAAANRAMLSRLVPSQQAAIDKAYGTALAAIADGPAKSAGIAAGEQAAAAVLAWRADDGAGAPERYRPATTAGVYIVTTVPAVPQWGQRKPWVLTSPSQFRPGPPPALTSELWARDYNEIKAIGAKNSTTRTPAQTETARFWEANGPIVYYPVVRSVANLPGREVTQNARLYALTAQAIDDALIAVFDAKYYYNFWRPITAIRNGDIDGNDATERDAGWTAVRRLAIAP